MYRPVVHAPHRRCGSGGHVTPGELLAAAMAALAVTTLILACAWPVARADLSFSGGSYGTAWLQWLQPWLAPVEYLLAKHVPATIQRWVNQQLPPVDLTNVAPTAARWLTVAILAAAVGLVLLVVAVQRTGFVAMALLAMSAMCLTGPVSRLRRRHRARLAAVPAELPVCLDMLSIALESGASLSVALTTVARFASPGPMRIELDHFETAMRAGRSRASALREIATRLPHPAVQRWSAAMLQADQAGSSMVPLLQAQAAQCIEERFTRAERAALQAPVKMLVPLVLCIFPCTFLVLALPVMARLLN